MINYKIINKNNELGSIEILPEGFPSFWLDLPIDEQGKVPTGEELHLYISGFLPVTEVLRKETIESVGINGMDEIKVHALDTLEGKFKDTISKSKELKLFNIKFERDNRLANSDWTQLPDAPLSKSVKSAWKQYRQELRDMFNEEIDLDNPVFPVPPNGKV